MTADILVLLGAILIVVLAFYAARWVARRRSSAERQRILLDASIDDLSPDELEEFVAQLFAASGAEARVLGKSGDHGLDVLARQGNKVYAVQVKHYSSNVGVDAISEIVRGMNLLIATGHVAQEVKVSPMVVTSAPGFTKQARQEAAILGVRLMARDGLEDWVVEVGKVAKNGSL